MKPSAIRIVDFSGGTDFRQSLDATRNLIGATAGLFVDGDVYAPTGPLAHVEFVSSDGPAVLTAALHAETLVLHLASHMHGRGEGEPAFFGRDDEITVSQVAAWLTEQGQGIYAACVYVDGCNGGTRKFVRAMRDCLEAPVTYVASQRMVGEPECTLFARQLLWGTAAAQGQGSGPARPDGRCRRTRSGCLPGGNRCRVPVHRGEGRTEQSRSSRIRRVMEIVTYR